MIWSFLEVRGVTCRSHLINLMTIGRDRIKKSKDKMLSMLPIANSVSLFFKFANDCRRCLEIKHRLRRTGLPSSDRKGKGSCFGDGFEQGHHSKGSQAHHVFSQVIRLQMWQGQALPPQGCVCFPMWKKCGHFYHFFSVPNGSRKKGRTICTSKKIHINLLGYRNKLGLDLLAFLLFPYPDVHFTLCPFAVGKCGADTHTYPHPAPQRQLQRKWKTNPCS